MSVITRGGILYIDFSCYTPDRRKIRCKESTGLRENEKNRKIARDKDRAIKYHLRAGTFRYLDFFPYGPKAALFGAPRGDMLLGEWWEEWIREKTLRPNTARNWESAYRIHIGPHFGAYPLGRIDEHRIRVFRASLERQGLKASSINDKIIKPLCMALYQAHRRGLIADYPCLEIGRLDEDPVDIDPFSFDELAHLLGVLSQKRPMYHDMIQFWARTGLRPGELCALKWTRVDWHNAKALIRETAWPSGAEGPPKTKHSIRDVDLRPLALEALKRQFERAGLQDSYVWMTRAGRPFSQEYLRKKFRFLLQLARIKYRPPAQLRHTFATLHLGAGENISWVSRMLGHATPDITWKRYNRFIPNLTREDGSAFEKAFDLSTSRQKMEQ